MARLAASPAKMSDDGGAFAEAAGSAAESPCAPSPSRARRAATALAADFTGACAGSGKEQ